jgi:hypothetical protein
MSGGAGVLLAGMRPAKDAEPPTPCLISCDAMPEVAA